MNTSQPIPGTLAASPVLNTADLNMRPQHDLCQIVAQFLSIGEGVMAHWVEFARGILLFVMAPGDARSGEFYIYDRKRGQFWLLELADDVFGGYGVEQMREKIRDFGLLRYAENPSEILALR